jgi:tRNA dimethylallyltransferase
MNANKQKLVVILGPTATGKTKLATRLAFDFGGEVISADSRQVFKGMDIGTGKDLKDYTLAVPAVKSVKSAKLSSKSRSTMASKGHKKPYKVPYHLIDIIRPMTPFNVAKYQKLAKKAIAEVFKKGHLPMLVGGTGLYIDAVIKGYEFFPEEKELRIKNYELRKKLDKWPLAKLLEKLQKIDPETNQKIDQKNRRRVQRAVEIYLTTGKKKSETDKMSESGYDLLILGIDYPLEKIYQKIDSRLETRIQEGMIKEIKKLRREGVSWKRLEEFGLEYRYVSRYLRGLITYEEMLEQLKNEIHHFAKRQLTWFKRNPDIVWLSDYQTAKKKIKEFLKK